MENITKFAHLFYCFIKTADSQHNIINLGYPKILAKILQEKFHKNSFLIARWLKEYNSWGSGNWLDRIGSKDLPELLKLYDAAQAGPDAYEDYLKKNDYYINDDDKDLERSKSHLEYSIKEALLNDSFFRSTLITDIINGTLNNLAPYKKMKFDDALKKYREKRVFTEIEPITSYDNGFKWINVGKRCELIRDKMKNCGSVGVMSMDPDSTMIALFDPHNNPKIVLTFSPNENRISGVEGTASMGASEEYHSYILDVINTLGADYDPNNPKSKLLLLKYNLKDFAKDIKHLYSTSFDSVYTFIDYNDNMYYTNTYYILTENDLKKAIDYVKSNSDLVKSLLRFKNEKKLKFEDYTDYVFNYRNRDNLEAKLGINYIYMIDFVRSIKNQS